MQNIFLRVFNRQNAGKILILLLVATFVTSCSKKNREERYIAREVGTLYNQGKTNLDRKNYALAAAYFDEVERQHPYTAWARRAQLMSAYSYYQANDYDEAILAGERFISLHPGNSSAPYAFYLIAISYYEQITDVGRDQRVTEQALGALTQVALRYPDTPYAEDALLKIDLTRDHLAGKEMEIGRFYQSQRQFLPALIRFRNVIDEYQNTTHIAEALHRMVEVYLAMGVLEEAQQVGAVLGHNFPASKWYKYSYSLLTGADLDLLDPRDKKFLGIFLQGTSQK
ncbi:MAG: outer membrane protein assembly factor BamD [Sphingomonadales bacterium]